MAKRTFTKYPINYVKANRYIESEILISELDGDTPLSKFFKSSDSWSDEKVDLSKAGVSITIRPIGDGKYGIHYAGINSPIGNDENVETIGQLFDSFEQFFNFEE